MKTVEQKAKAYNKAVKEASIAYKDGDKYLKATLERIFPELIEPDDERIRKDIIRVLKGEISFTSEKENEKYITWLEKQGKLNPYSMKETTWNKEDEENMNNVLYILNQLKDISSYEEDNIGKKTINWLKSLKERIGE